MAYRELRPLIKKSPSFRGVMSATRYVCVHTTDRFHSIRFG